MGAPSIPRRVVAKQKGYRVAPSRKDSQRLSPRAGMAVLVNDRPVGKVTSGCPSPTLGYPIAMGYVGKEHAAEGTSVEVDLGRERIGGKVVKMPFYKKS